jgi:hypothetical protein
VSLKTEWAKKYSLVVLVVDIGAYATVLWLTDIFAGFSSLTGYEYQTILDAIPFVTFLALPIYCLSGSKSYPVWLFFMLAPELIIIIWALLYWSFPYIVPFLIQIPLLVSTRNRYYFKSRQIEGYGRNRQKKGINYNVEKFQN